MVQEHNEAESKHRNSFYDKVIKVAGTFYKDLKSNIVLFIGIFIVITGVLLFINSKRANTYSASFTVTYEELVRKVYGDRLTKLNTLIKSNIDKAQEYLDIEKEAVESIIKISPTNIMGDELTEDVNTDKIPFVVNIQLDDTTYVGAVQQGIIHYLETSNDYQIAKRQLKQKEITEELAFIDEQLALMDSLKKKLQQTEVSMPSTEQGSSSPKSSGSVYEVSYQLYKKKQELLKKKELPLNLYVIDDAIVPVKNSKPLILVVLAGLIISTIIYTIIAYFVLPVVRYSKN